MKVLHLEENHPALIEGLRVLGIQNDLAYDDSLDEVLAKLDQYDGLIIRSKYPIDETFLTCAKKLKFIGRVGAGLENIDVPAVESRNIHLLNAPEGNRNAVGEHALAMLLALMNKLRVGHTSIQSGQWDREGHRGWELSGRTVGIIGYGNTGKSFAKRISGFNVRTLCYDILENVGDEYAQQVNWETLISQSEVISLHIPKTDLTRGLIDKKFIDSMDHAFWLLNTGRGSAVVTKDLVKGLKSKKIIGAGLDVLEYETRSFSSIFNQENLPPALQYLMEAKNVLLSPHVAGWTQESHVKLATTVVDKIKELFF
ncbi:MAG: 2-hydroxyacid dehydrogenase [Flavobacteriaceae bacterium]|jgi:D-3-phosphoglycerate dehydrogenase|nr:2-hydroxyacid dehydrogenase [Flavobacteriaceae bacterium]MDG1965790.1 2-hydroxyacid dehydrogenase [Flavobacteriaceae bacterium]